MDAFKIAVKLFATRDVFTPSEFVPVFQRWIQAHALTEHLLVDVADYDHVVHGPGTVLISSQANLSTDRAGGRLGLLYARKLPLEGDFRRRLSGVLTSSLQAAMLLQNEPTLAGRLGFRTDEMLIRINDRLLAPNTPQTFAAVKPHLQAIAAILYGDEKTALEYQPSPLTVFEVRLKTDQSPSLQTMLDRISRQPA